QLFSQREGKLFGLRIAPIIGRYLAAHALKYGKACAQYALRWLEEQRACHLETGSMSESDRRKFGDDRRSDSARVIAAHDEFLGPFGNTFEGKKRSLFGTAP